jgi:hypothetical protein
MTVVCICSSIHTISMIKPRKTVKDIIAKIAEHQSMIADLRKDIETIQMNCDHNYVSVGVVFDPCRSFHEYKCLHCDHVSLKRSLRNER